MPNAIEQFFRRPSKRTYLAARRVAVARLGGSPPVDVFDFQALEVLFQLRRFDQVLEQAEELVDRYPLSPRLYFLAGVAAEEVGDPTRMGFYRSRAQCCIGGIGATGTGDRKSPFQSTYLTDARMIAAVMGREAVRQRVIDFRGSTLDELECDDGSKLYFHLLQLDAVIAREDSTAMDAAIGQNLAKRTPTRAASRVAGRATRRTATRQPAPNTLASGGSANGRRRSKSRSASKGKPVINN
ncbi:MAG: hypothetical protein FJ295_06860 [Planctomycetes bacterium]|nr:hypothetical protein [Planctomycetota bacterium]